MGHQRYIVQENIGKHNGRKSFIDILHEAWQNRSAELDQNGSVENNGKSEFYSRTYDIEDTSVKVQEYEGITRALIIGRPRKFKSIIENMEKLTGFRLEAV